jgi:N-ethylmaleimide reductase
MDCHVVARGLEPSGRAGSSYPTMSSYPLLLSPLRVGALALKHRVVMAPLTRMRSAQPGDVPQALNVEYYRQRASDGGLIISEATQISLQGKGYPAAPGIHNAAQVAGWRTVTEAVHGRGGFIVLQLWHVGRNSHSSLHPEDGLPVAPSAITPRTGQALRADFQPVEYEVPRALETAEIPGIVEQYRRGAQNAKDAGFDGVEIHSANGYLLDQFLENGSNHRTDQYGGSIENRARLLMDVTDAVTGVWGADRVGVRLSPFGSFGDMHDSDPVALFRYVLEQLSRRKIAYAHLVEPRVGNAGADVPLDLTAARTAEIFRTAFRGVLISAGGYTPEEAERALETNHADAIAFGRLFISNPDLVERIRQGAPLNLPDRTTFYGGTDVGYTDYPALEGTVEDEEAAEASLR